MRVLWLLEELGVDYELVLHTFDRALRNPEYLKLSPAGRVPALEIDGDVLWESGAINEYLCERFPEKGLGRAPGHPERAEWLILMHFAETISQHAAALTQQHIVIYDDAMRSPTVMKLEAKRLEKCFEAIEHHLDQRPHLLMSGFSSADVGIGQAIYMARRFVRLDPFPALSDWYDQITKRKAFRTALPPEGSTPLYQKDFYSPWVA